ncbi:PAS domain-containing protein [Skermanella pratensis]|uniref:PAS domain-containing protein n=1 Tax=Skermanella pratensis TaxID=2233999 RepID=UPI0013013EB8|nr:PAS domain-containing protein [Skermanella pratensis]
MRTLASKHTILLAAASATLTATSAYAQTPGVDLGPSGSSITLGAAALAGIVGLAWQTLRAHGKSRRAADLQEEIDRLEALLSASPDAWCGWSPDGTHAISPGFAGLLGIDRCDRLEDIETALAPSDAAALNGAFGHLRRTGQPFRIVVTTADGGRVLELSGSRGTGSAGGEKFDVLWARDIGHITGEITRQTQARTAALQTLEEIRAMLDRVPFPIWLRRRDLSIAWCNKAYADALDLTRDEALERQSELVPASLDEPRRSLAERARTDGAARSETQHLVIDGARRLIEITEARWPRPQRYRQPCWSATRST